MAREARLLFVLTMMLATLTGAGCATHGPANPTFGLTVDDAWDELDEMAGWPQPLDRPVIVLAGWLDPGVASTRVEQALREATTDPRVVAVNFAWTTDFESCRQRVIDAVDDAFPSDDPVWTTEVDVVAISMGGLVARHAAADPPRGDPVRRLRVARLFTISTPHRGASLAGLPTFDQRQRAMRPGSPFLDQLDGALDGADYTIYPYVRLGDAIVGEANAAPAGQSPIWLPNRRLELAHVTAYRDPRILADIARRLRGEPAFADDPPAPLPGEAEAVEARLQ